MKELIKKAFLWHLFVPRILFQVFFLHLYLLGTVSWSHSFHVHPAHFHRSDLLTITQQHTLYDWAKLLPFNFSHNQTVLHTISSIWILINDENLHLLQVPCRYRLMAMKHDASYKKPRIQQIHVTTSGNRCLVLAESSQSLPLSVCQPLSPCSPPCHIPLERS